MSGKRRRDTPERAMGAGAHRRLRRLPLARGPRPARRSGQAVGGGRARPCGPGAGGRARPQGMSPIDYLFSEKREMLVRMIEFDEEWSGLWIAAHPRPRTPAVSIQVQQE